MSSRLHRPIVACIVWVYVTVGTASAGMYSLSFPATYCAPALVNGPTLGDASGGAGEPNKGAESFAASTTGITLYCDVMFPRSVVSATFGVNLTWQVGSNPGVQNVCWKAAYEVTRVGQAWGLNLAGDVPFSTPVYGPIGSGFNVDVQTSITDVVGTDQAGVTCPVQTADGSCAGDHGMLAIVRMKTAECPSEYAGAALLTRIEITGTTP